LIPGLIHFSPLRESPRGNRQRRAGTTKTTSLPKTIRRAASPAYLS